PLGGGREEQRVRLLDDVEARVELGEDCRRAHAWPAGFVADEVLPPPTRQRLGSWCSRYWRRVIQPKIIEFVIHHLSGRTAKYTCAITRPTSPTPARPCARYVKPHAESVRMYGFRATRPVRILGIIIRPVATTPKPVTTMARW